MSSKAFPKQLNKNQVLKVLIATRVLTKVELNQLLKQAIQIGSMLYTEQTIRLNYQNQFKLKTITHDDAEHKVLCLSEQVKQYRINISPTKDFTITVSTIQEKECTEGTAQDICLSHNLWYNLEVSPEWILNISIIKMINNPQEFSAHLVEYKNNLLKKYDDIGSEIEETAYDMVSLELQFVGEDISKQDTADIIQYVDRAFVQDQHQEYQQTIYSMAKEIYRDHNTTERFKGRSGFKQLVPSVVELSRTMYFKDVLPIIDQFYITDKLDGQRGLLQIVEYFKSDSSRFEKSRRRKLLGTEIISLSNEVQHIKTFDKKPNQMRGIDIVKTILDTEMIRDGDHTTFYAFDVIMMKGKRVSNLPFKLRFKEFDAADQLLSQYHLGKTKPFIKLTKDKYKDQLDSFYSAALAGDHEIDGIIFTPEGLHYKEAIKQKAGRVNTEYYNTISFKWKPLKQSTIDFYLMPIDPIQAKKLRKAAGLITNSSEYLYALCSGIDILTFKRLRMQFFDGYVAPESENSHQYFPIQFSPYDNPNMYLWPSKESNLGGKVAEFKFIGSDGTMLKVPEIVRIRDDRTNDVRKGEYFGNALRYAELLWHSIKHPLTFEMLGQTANELGGYFASTSENDYFAQRAFNSYIKGELIKAQLTTPSIVDLMCGKGQDLARVIENGFTEITMIDRDIDALYELLQRKYNLRLRTKDASASVHIRQVDFENTFEDIIRDTDLPTEVNAAMLNFGIHYLAHDKTENNANLPLDDLFRLVAHMLKVGGRFLITCFDGQTIFNLLKETNEWTTTNKKYSIKRAYTSDEFTNLNQPIDVLLPFSGGSYYREFLVNMSFLESIADSHGFKIIVNESFGSMLKQFKKHNSKVFNQLDESDKEWIRLYSYVVFEKTA